MTHCPKQQRPQPHVQTLRHEVDAIAALPAAWIPRTNVLWMRMRIVGVGLVWGMAISVAAANAIRRSAIIDIKIVFGSIDLSVPVSGPMFVASRRGGTPQKRSHERNETESSAPLGIFACFSVTHLLARFAHAATDCIHPPFLRNDRCSVRVSPVALSLFASPFPHPCFLSLCQVPEI